MKLNEAIKEQKLYLQHSDKWTHERLDQALLLSSEAMKKLQTMREAFGYKSYELLPGETEE